MNDPACVCWVVSLVCLDFVLFAFDLYTFQSQKLGRDGRSVSVDGEEVLNCSYFDVRVLSLDGVEASGAKHVGSKHVGVHVGEVDAVGKYHYNSRGVGLPWRRADGLPFIGVFFVHIHDVSVVKQCCFTLAERTAALLGAGLSRLPARMLGLASRFPRGESKCAFSVKVRYRGSRILLLGGLGEVH